MNKKPTPVVTLPDLLAMTASGQPAPGTRMLLPSGAVWSGGAQPGTTMITLPDDGPIAIGGSDPGALPGALVGGVLSAFEQALDLLPGTITDQVFEQAMELLGGAGGPDTPDTRIVRISSKSTLFRPADAPLTEVVDRNSGGWSFAGDGRVSGPGGPTGDQVPARLSDGEYVVNAAATANSLPLLEAINAGWVPSADYLNAMLPGFADGGLVGGSPAMMDPQRWRGLLGPGVMADVASGVANAAINAAGSVGAALGSEIAPAFGSLFGPSRIAPSSPASSATAGPLSASMAVVPQGLMAGVAGIPTSDSAMGASGEGPTVLGALSAALSQGIVSAATDAGGRVGAALGAAIAPALGPAGQLAPEIGDELGRLIGARFGGGLTASMTLTSNSPQVTPGAATGGGGFTAPVGTLTDPRNSGGFLMLPGPDGQATIVTANGIPYAGGGSSGGMPLLLLGGSGSGGPVATGVPDAFAQDLALGARTVNYADGDVVDRAAIAGSQLANASGLPLGTLGAKLGSLVGAFGGPRVAQALAPGNPLLQSLGIDPEADYLVPEGQKPTVFEFDQLQLAEAGIEGFLSGTANGGLVKGITGAANGLLSTGGGQLGSALGAAIGTAVGGPLAPIAGAVGGVIGSAIGGAVGDVVLKPIEYAAETAKELFGTGLGLVDLAEGPGAHTARGDFFNFNGMDPKSAAIAVERVRRRRVLAQQRGGGLGR